MAIFGEFSELPFPEVLHMLGRRSGQLHVRQAADRYVLHLDNDHLLALSRNDRALHDPHHVRDAILRLARSTDGHFEFHRESPNTLTRHHELSVTRLLLGASTVIDEISHYRDRLPAPDTRFVLLDAATRDLDPELAAFVTRAEATLLLGGSAHDLSAALGMHVEQVQLTLYKLRTHGLIAPLRARVATIAPAPVFATETRPEPETPGLIARLLGALKGRRKAHA